MKKALPEKNINKNSKNEIKALPEISWKPPATHWASQSSHNL